MTCDICREKLGPYVDGNCSEEELRALEEHLQNCPLCSTEALSLEQMKRMTRAASAERFIPSPQFRLRVQGSIGNRTKKPRKPLFAIAWMPSLATAAVAFLVIATSFVWVRHSQREQAVTELLDLHVAALASANPVDVVSTDRHTVKPWFQGKLAFAFDIPELGNSPYKLLGGKLVYFRHSPGAQLLFTLGNHRLSVFILQDQAGLAAATVKNNGFSVESWSERGLHYVVISDASPSDVHALGDLLRTAGQQ